MKRSKILYTVLPQKGIGYTVSVVVLTLAVFGSALAVIEFKHESRKRYAELQKLQNQVDELHVEWTRLLLEQGAKATNARVEKVARELLHMHLPAPGDVVVLR